MATATITFSPIKAPQGSKVTVTPTITGLAAAARIEVWGFTQPNVLQPTTEQGWSKLGGVAASGGSFQWDTSQLLPGTHAIATVVYDQAGAVIATWVRGSANTLPLVQYEVLPPAEGVTGFLASLQAAFSGGDPVPLLAAAAAVAGVGYLLLRGKD